MANLHCAGIRMVCPPYIVRQHEEVRPVLPGRLVVAQSALEAALVLVPDPAPVRRLQLCAACAEPVQACTSVEVVWDLVGGVWLAIDDTTGEMCRRPSIDTQVNNCGD